MKKDLFIDNNIAKNFCNPMDKEYIKLINLLLYFDENDRHNIDNYAHLVGSQKLLNEYIGSAMNAISDTSIPAIIDRLTREGRLWHISNVQIKQFQQAHFSKKQKKI